jgi:hypothetical protein
MRKFAQRTEQFDHLMAALGGHQVALEGKTASATTAKRAGTRKKAR